MDTLSIIKKPICTELELLNRVLLESLQTKNELLNSVVGYYLETKGKQMRPILVLLAARMFGEVSATTIDAAVSIELLHNASLIHDDVVDESDKRRGRESVNALWDNKIAVLVGDFFVSSALHKALATRNLKIIGTLSRLGEELASGEIDQLTNSRDHVLNEEAYFHVIQQKTASLFMACMRMGALSVDAPAEQLCQLELFGEKLGLCFQIKDDIFDYYENAEIGKPTGNDIREGKVTLPLLFALTRHRDERRDRMFELVKKSTLTQGEINTLIGYAREMGGLEYADCVMRKLRNEAVDALAGFVNTEVCEALIHVLDYTLNRKN